MANDLEEAISGYVAPPAFSRGVDDILRSCLAFSSNGIATGMLVRVPYPDEKRALQERHRTLLASWKHDRKKVAVAVSTMLTAFTRYHTINGGEAQKAQFRDIVVNYVTELQGIPTWACEDACNRIRTGNAGPDISITHPPSTTEVVTMARQCASVVKAELTSIDSVLGGQVKVCDVPPAERDLLKAKMTALAGELKARHAPQMRSSVEDAMAVLTGIISPEDLAKIPNAKPAANWKKA